VQKKSLTIVVPALNEAHKISDTVEELIAVASRKLDDFEMVLIDDGSTDQTENLMEGFARRDPRIRVVHNPVPQGVGGAFMNAVATAKFDSLVLVPGDHAYRADGVERLIDKLGAADVVISYRDNQTDRSFFRSSMSHALRTILNVMFRFKLNDYHSMIIYPVRPVRQIDTRTRSYGYQIEVIVSLLQMGLTFVQVPVSLNAELPGSSRAVRMSTFIELGKTMIRLLLRRPIRHLA
jgi:dolichol-phosphate mannosyltransferase